MILLSFKGHQLLHGSVERQGEHESSTWAKLLDPGRGDIPGAHRQDNPIVRRHLWVPRAVSTDHLHVRVAGGRQVGAGILHDVLVKVHRNHTTVRPHNVGHERGVVAGSRPISRT
jgi:hypothetical protein